MSTKLFVGNIAHQMRDTDLQTIFSEAGNVVSAKIITDRDTGQPRGFGRPRLSVKNPPI